MESPAGVAELADAQDLGILRIEPRKRADVSPEWAGRGPSGRAPYPEAERNRSRVALHRFDSAIYSYWGYYNICHLGAEIRESEKNIPRGIFLSILGITLLYLAMQTSILSAVPWREAGNSPFLASFFIERLHGPGAARLVTCMVLWVALGSVFSVLATPRALFRGARQQLSPGILQRSPCQTFPSHLSALPWRPILYLIFCLTLELKTAIAAILAMPLLVQFIGQTVGVILLHNRWPPNASLSECGSILFPLLPCSPAPSCSGIWGLSADGSLLERARNARGTHCFFESGDGFLGTIGSEENCGGNGARGVREGKSQPRRCKEKRSPGLSACSPWW